MIITPNAKQAQTTGHVDQAEHIPVVASLVHRKEITPELLRRNLVVSGINLIALKGRRFMIGECELEGTGPCDPCSRMEENWAPAV